MERDSWQELLLPSGNQDLLYELFHENSKVGRYSQALSNEEVRARMAQFHESLPYEGYPIISLPHSFASLQLSLSSAITARVSTRNLSAVMLPLDQVAALLHFSYGVSRTNDGINLSRPFRVVPSGGALYPLEIYFHSAYVKEHVAGLYHYNPSKHHLRLLREGKFAQTISERIIQPELALNASLIIFITAIFERSVFKYGDRGYRFIFLEAGHVAQNINLVATAFGLGCVNIGGFFDREIDDFLDLDGVTHSAIYMIAIGGLPKSVAESTDEYQSI